MNGDYLIAAFEFVVSSLLLRQIIDEGALKCSRPDHAALPNNFELFFYLIRFWELGWIYDFQHPFVYFFFII